MSVSSITTISADSYMWLFADSKKVHETETITAPTVTPLGAKDIVDATAAVEVVVPIAITEPYETKQEETITALQNALDDSHARFEALQVTHATEVAALKDLLQRSIQQSIAKDQRYTATLAVVSQLQNAIEVVETARETAQLDLEDAARRSEAAFAQHAVDMAAMQHLIECSIKKLVAKDQRHAVVRTFMLDRKTTIEVVVKERDDLKFALYDLTRQSEVREAKYAAELAATRDLLQLSGEKSVHKDDRHAEDQELIRMYERSCACTYDDPEGELSPLWRFLWA